MNIRNDKSNLFVDAFSRIFGERSVQVHILLCKVKLVLIYPGLC